MSNDLEINEKTEPSSNDNPKLVNQNYLQTLSFNENINDNSHQSTTDSRITKLINFFTIKTNNFALAILCACALMQNVIVGGANNAILTTIERAYYMTSIESALFLSVYDIANIIASPIIGYFGDRYNKTKIIGLSMIGLSLGSFIMILPELALMNGVDQFEFSNENDTEFLRDQVLCYQTTQFADNLNTSSGLITTTTVSNKILVSNRIIKNMKYIFYLSNMINGVSSVALYTIVISYIECIFLKEQAHMRQGIYYAIGAIGVGIGMLITGNFLYINGVKHKKASKKTALFNSNSFNWIGAWWIIYIISAVINCLLSILVFLFSPTLILTDAARASTNNQTDSTLDKPIKSHLKDFFKNAFSILSNRVFLFIVICTTCETFLIKGFSSYLTKYLEYQYRLSASNATMIAGAISFISLVFGALLGAYLIRRFKWHIKECSKFVLVILFITSVLFLGLIIHCPQEKYINEENNVFLKSECNCDSNTFYPICYKNSYIFQTPCHAGCTRFMRPNSYFKCKVLDSYLGSQLNETVLLPCQRPVPYCIPNLILVSFIGLGVLFLSSVVILPILRIILESISVENQSFALGIRSLISKLFGNIPGPIVFATVVDKSCIQWTKSPYTGNKTCRLYNNRNFSIGLGTLGSIIRFLSGIFALITFYFIKKQKSIDISSETNITTNAREEQNTKYLSNINKAYVDDENRVAST